MSHTRFDNTGVSQVSDRGISKKNIGDMVNLIAQEANKARIDELTIFPMALSAAEYIAYKTKRRAVLNIRLTAEKGKA